MFHTQVPGMQSAEWSQLGEKFYRCVLTLPLFFLSFPSYPILVPSNLSICLGFELLLHSTKSSFPSPYLLGLLRFVLPMVPQYVILFSSIFRKFELYSPSWSVNLEPLLVAAAPFGGPIATIRDDSKISRLQDKTKPEVSVIIIRSPLSLMSFPSFSTSFAVAPFFLWDRSILPVGNFSVLSCGNTVELFTCRGTLKSDSYL